MQPGRSRHLAAVMFTDMVGYTTLVSQDEERARLTRARLRALLSEALAPRGGMLIQSFGDGTLSLFPSAVDAVRGAAEIQAKLAGEPGIELRIGLHMGEVAHDAEGIYGDAVNVAARIQAVATPGSVLFSEEVAKQLRNHKDLPFANIGSVLLKNVADPVRVFALTLEGLPVPTAGEIGRRAREGGGGAAAEVRVPRSLAVLPLANLSGDPAQEYFVAGMHEALLTELSRIGALKVISRTSVLRFRDTFEPMPGIAATLGVEALIEGSVLRDGDRVRITAQLIAFEPERHLWAESYDGDLSDVLGLHRRVASAVAGAVHSALRPREEERLRTRQSVDPDAYEAYLRGRFAAGRISEGDALAAAIRDFEIATAIDPLFPLPWVGIARSLGYRAVFGHEDRRRTVERAAQAIDRALTLDPELGEALAVRGQLSLVFNADAAAAVRDLERAVAQEPNNVQMLIDYAVALNASGRFEDASNAMDRAAERDPLSPTTAMMRGFCRYIGRRYDQARQILEQAARVTPDFSYHPLWLAAAFIGLGLEAEARAAARRAEQIEGETDDVNFLCVLGWLHAMTGSEPRARQIRDGILELRAQGKSVDATFLVVIETGLGDTNAALDHFRDAIAERSPVLFHIPTHPMIDRLRGDARFRQLMSDAGLEPLDGAS